MMRPRFYADRYFDVGADVLAEPEPTSRAHAERSGADGEQGGLAELLPFVQPPAPVLVSGPLRVDVAAHEVTVNGEAVPLTRLELRLLAFFVRHPHRAFTREEIVGAVWKTPWDGRGRTVDVHVTRLRTKLAAIHLPLQTVHGVGYRYRPRVVGAS